jgi:hypothetical protein
VQKVVGNRHAVEADLFADLRDIEELVVLGEKERLSEFHGGSLTPARTEG